MNPSVKLVALLVVAVGVAAQDDCKGGLSCVQQDLFRKAKSFFDQDNIELWGGLSLKRTPSREDRQLAAAEEDVKKEEDPEKKEQAIEEYALDRASRFLEERSITWNLADAARSIQQAMVSEETEEGRGKKKKLLKSLLPILIGIKMKLVGFLILSYFVIAFIAKKALLASLISLAVSGFIAIRKLMSGQAQVAPHHEVHEVAHGWAGPSYGSSGGWDSGAYDAHGAYSSNVAHSIAYPAQKPAAARFSSEKNM